MLAFEGTSMGKNKDIIVKLDIIGFDCYVNGEHDVMVRLTNCWDYDYASQPVKPDCFLNPTCPEFNRKRIDMRIDGNVYCAHRDRATALNHLFNENSLYKYVDGKRGDLIRDAFLSTEDASYDNNMKYTNPSDDPASAFPNNKFFRRTGRDPVTGKRKWH